MFSLYLVSLFLAKATPEQSKCPLVERSLTWTPREELSTLLKKIYWNITRMTSLASSTRGRDLTKQQSGNISEKEMNSIKRFYNSLSIYTISLILSSSRHYGKSGDRYLYIIIDGLFTQGKLEDPVFLLYQAMFLFP